MVCNILPDSFSLNSDVLGHVFSFLNLKEQAIASRVSKVFFQANRDNFEVFSNQLKDINIFESSDFLEKKIIKLRSAVYELSLGSQDEDVLSMIFPILSDCLLAKILSVLENAQNLSRLELSWFYLTSSRMHTLGMIANRLENLKKLKISHAQIDENLTKELCFCFDDLEHLEELDLSFNLIRNDGMIVLSEYLHKLKKLSYLNLSFNFIGTESVSAFSRRLSLQQMLKTLIVSGNAIKSIGAFHILLNLDSVPFFESLELSFCCIEDISILAKDDLSFRMRQIKKIILDDNAVDLRTFRLFVERIPILDKMETFSFSGNYIGETGGDFFGKNLYKFPRLAHLNLSRNSLQDKGVIEIAKNFKHIPFLESLDLSMNDFGTLAAICLSENFSYLSILKKLDLDKNLIGALGANLISDSLRQLKSSNPYHKFQAAYADLLKVHNVFLDKFPNANNLQSKFKFF